jgi:DNA primase
MAIGLHTINEQIRQLEEMLIKTIVRDGEKVIYENVATADGGTINLSVAQFIDYDLGSDGLSFSNPVYNKILQEVVAHMDDEDFKAEEYLMRNPDYEVSSVAADVAVDPYQLSKSFQMKEREGGLRQHVEHLVLDFRYYCLKEKVEELKVALKNCKDDYMSIMQELVHVDSLYKELAKKLGR